jgi:hypothetical protein
MPQHRRIRLEVVIEEIGLPLLTERLTEAGALGWTVVPAVLGSGRQGVREPDHVAGISGNSLLLTLAKPEDAERFIAVAAEVVARFSGLVVTNEVTVHTP